jgi:pimeloyl-ACP methyl ester carboxylesterase
MGRFAVFGYSGGASYALAGAALLPDRVTRCAIGAGVAPPHADVGDSPGRQMPGRGESFRLAAQGEGALRPRLEQVAHQIMAAVEAGGPEMLPEPAAPGQHAPTPPRALDDPAAMARLRATFVDSHDGWVDDLLAVVRPWGFDLDAITVPIGIWHGRNDTRVSSAHADWLTATIPTARRHDHDGGHVPTAAVHDDMLIWLKG